MRQLCLLLAITFTVMCSAQSPPGSPPSANVGFNMPNATSGFKSVYDSMYYVNMLPAGGSFCWRDRYDKLNETPAQVIAVNNFLKSKQRNGFSDIFVFSDSVSIETNMQAMRALRDGGVTLKAAAYVNEPFYTAGGYSFNWSAYEPGYTAFCQAVTAEFPGLPLLLPIAPKPLSLFTKAEGGGSNHDTWNNAGFAFKNAHPQYNIVGGDVHIYYTGAFVPELGATATTDETATDGKSKVRIKAPTSRVYNYQTDTIDESYWRNIFYQSDPTIFWERMLNYLQSHGLDAYVTEAGYIDHGALNGSWTIAANAFELVNMYGADPRVKSFNWHAGGPSAVGILGNRKTFDVREPENPYTISSATFDAFAMYFNTPGGIYPYTAGGIEITGPGVYSLWYLNGNKQGFAPIFYCPSNLELSYTVTCVTGVRFSSLSRSMEFCKKGSVLGANEVSRVSYYANPPAMSFGYIVVTVVPKDVPGCTDPEAIGYNPEATIDDGSCIERVFGCMDINALNYNSLANTPDGSCIAKVFGCTNPEATNYDATANVDDGSCTLPPPVVKPCRGLCSWFPRWCKCSKPVSLPLTKNVSQ